MLPKKVLFARMQLHATKCTNIIRQGTGLYFATELIKKLKVAKFSVIIDETTDVATEKQLGIVVIFCDNDSLNIKTEFFDLLPTHDGSADGIYSSLKQSFTEKDIPMDNVIGYSSDTANVMFGERNSVVGLLKKDCPHVVTIRCSCHMIHLCASYACKKLSISLEDMLRNIHAHFSRSSQRIKNFKEFQEFCKIPVHKLLGLAQTRWLSLESVVNRILEQWPALNLYFTDYVANKCDPSNTIKTILQALNNKFHKAVLEFVSFQLKRINALNTMFQMEAPMLHHLKDEVTKLLKEILCDFMKVEFVRQSDPFEVDINIPCGRVPIDYVYVGVAATATLAECVQNDPIGVRQVRQSCLNFIVELVEQICKRFKEVNEKSLSSLKFLIPSNAIKCFPSTLSEAYECFKFLKEVAPLELVDMEWRKQAIEESCVIDDNVSDMEFWKNRLLQKSVAGDLKYKHLSKVIGCLMSLPFANAPVERLFSSLKAIKTDHRNRSKQGSVVGLLHTRHGLKSLNVPADKLSLADHPRLLKLIRNVKSNATYAFLLLIMLHK